MCCYQRLGKVHYLEIFFLKYGKSYYCELEVSGGDVIFHIYFMIT